MNYKKMLEKVINDIEKLGYELYPITEIKEMTAVGTYGSCRFNPVSKTCKIKINNRLNYEDTMNTIYHEVCHAIVGAEGHGRVWKKAAREVYKNYGYNIQRTDSHKLYDKEGNELKNEDIYKYKVVCSDCGNEYNYMKKTKAIRSPEYYRCTCGGVLHSYTIDDKLIA